MEKKENGTPRTPACSPTPDGEGMTPEGGQYNCGGGGCLDEALLAYVYAPNQKFRMLYSAHDALSHGTLFEELYKPTGVYGNE